FCQAKSSKIPSILGASEILVMLIFFLEMESNSCPCKQTVVKNVISIKMIRKMKVIVLILIIDEMILRMLQLINFIKCHSEARGISDSSLFFYFLNFKYAERNPVILVTFVPSLCASWFIFNHNRHKVFH